MAAAAATAPRKAATGTRAGGLRVTIQRTAAAEAPALMPITSGATRGLRTRPWKMAPAMASIGPTRRAARIRGRRRSRTMKVADGGPWPAMACAISDQEKRRSEERRVGKEGGCRSEPGQYV